MTRRPTIPRNYPPQLGGAIGTFTDQPTDAPFAPMGTLIAGGAPPYTYTWTLHTKPEGSAKVSGDIVGANLADFTSFTPDLPGRYNFALQVTDAVGTVAEGQTDILIGDLGADGRYWLRLVIDCTAEPAQNWRVGGPHTLGGYTLTIVHQADQNSIFGPDGATGVVIKPLAGSNWHAAARNATVWSVSWATLFPLYASGHGICVTADWSGAYTADNQGFCTAIEKTGMPAAGWGIREGSYRLVGVGSALLRAESFSGGASANRDSAAGISVIRHQIARWNDQDVSLRYNTVIAPANPVPGDAGLTLLTSSDHLGVQRQLGCGDIAQLTPATDVLSMSAFSWGVGTPTYVLTRLTLHWRP